MPTPEDKRAVEEDMAEYAKDISDLSSITVDQKLIDRLTEGSAIVWRDFGDGTIAYVTKAIFNYRLHVGGTTPHAGVWDVYDYEGLILPAVALHLYDGEGAPVLWIKSVMGNCKRSPVDWVQVTVKQRTEALRAIVRGDSNVVISPMFRAFITRIEQCCGL